MRQAPLMSDGSASVQRACSEARCRQGCSEWCAPQKSTQTWCPVNLGNNDTREQSKMPSVGSCSGKYPQETQVVSPTQRRSFSQKSSTVCPDCPLSLDMIKYHLLPVDAEASQNTFCCRRTLSPSASPLHRRRGGSIWEKCSTHVVTLVN